jgi:hypothetical protein
VNTTKESLDAFNAMEVAFVNITNVNIDVLNVLVLVCVKIVK